MTLLIYRWCRICTTIRKDFFRSMLTLAGPLRMWQMQSVPIRAFVRILRFLFPNQPFDTLNHPIQKIIDFVHIIAPEHSLELLVVDVEGLATVCPQELLARLVPMSTSLSGPRFHSFRSPSACKHPLLYDYNRKSSVKLLVVKLQGTHLVILSLFLE